MSDPFPLPVDRLAPDAPLIALMTLRENPEIFLALSHEDQLAVVRRVRTIVQQPVTLKAELARDRAATPKPRGVAAAAKVSAAKDFLGI